MSTIGVEDLKENATEIVANVARDRVEYVVMQGGTPVAALTPIAQTSGEPTDEELEREWDEWFEEMDRIAAEVEKVWPKGLSAADAVAQQRR